MIEPFRRQKFIRCASTWAARSRDREGAWPSRGSSPCLLPASPAKPPLPLRWPAQAAFPLRQSFNRLCVAQSIFHSLSQATFPRLINRSQPRVLLICPNTGSTVWPRFLYRRRPRVVSSVRSMRSRAVSPFGQRPRGGCCSRSAWRCFQSLVVAINSAGPAGSASVRLASLQEPASARAVVRIPGYANYRSWV